MRTGHATNILEKLNEKFSENLEICLSEKNTKLETAEKYSRAVFRLGQILRDKYKDDPTRKEITFIFDELFSDLTISLYLASTSIDNPAYIILRRVLELGVSIVYLWDLPDIFWGWKKHDRDLSFNEMIEHINSQGYVSYLEAINGQVINNHKILNGEANALYREMSNKIHGKMLSFETLASTEFVYKYNPKEWDNFLCKSIKVQEILFELWETRFPIEYKNLLEKQPSLELIKK